MRKNNLTVSYINPKGRKVIISRHRPTYGGLRNAYKTALTNPWYVIQWEGRELDLDKSLSLLQAADWCELSELDENKWKKEGIES